MKRPASESYHQLFCNYSTSFQINSVQERIEIIISDFYIRQNLSFDFLNFDICFVYIIPALYISNLDRLDLSMC